MSSPRMSRCSTGSRARRSSLPCCCSTSSTRISATRRIDLTEMAQKLLKLVLLLTLAASLVALVVRQRELLPWWARSGAAIVASSNIPFFLLFFSYLSFRLASFCHLHLHLLSCFHRSLSPSNSSVGDIITVSFVCAFSHEKE